MDFGKNPKRNLSVPYRLAPLKDDYPEQGRVYYPWVRAYSKTTPWTSCLAHYSQSDWISTITLSRV